MKYTDLLLVDIKHIDTECHKTLTGRSNENILDMIRYLSDIKKPIWIRHVLVPERSDKDEYLTRLADFIHSLDNVEKVEILPYHTMGIYKWKELGLEYPLEGIEPPTKERVENAKKILAISIYQFLICKVDDKRSCGDIYGRIASMTSNREILLRLYFVPLICRIFARFRETDVTKIFFRILQRI